MILFIARRLGAFVVCLMLLASCGSAADETEVTSSTDASESTAAVSDTSDAAGDEDHDDEDHDDEDHDDEDHEDHDDEDHDDEDHDDEDHDDHDDEDHDDEATAVSDEADEDHDDEDHDDEDHDDEDHDDEDHDDEDHEDHDDHDDEDHHDHDHDDETSSGLGAHVHGEAELFIAWADEDVVIDFVSPAENIFGFEREPSTDEETAIVAERSEVLGGSTMVVMNSEAECTSAGQAEPELEVEESHAEVTVSWVLRCENPSEIAELDASELFAEFPSILDVDAQWVSDAGQSAAELTPSSTTLRFG